VQKELDRAETLFVQLSHCHHFGNMHSRQPHAPLQLNVHYYSTSTSNFPLSLRHPVVNSDDDDDDDDDDDETKN
jgi:hypothetical protein